MGSRRGTSWLALVLMATSAQVASGYERYRDGCNSCHSDFTDGVSPKGTVFPSDDKHAMHRGSSFMNTECDLCHSSGDNRNPFLGVSDGTNSTTGYGCMGCHGRLEDAGNDTHSAGLGAGLRQHHFNNGIAACGDARCHSDGNPASYAPVGEDVLPPYFGSPDTNVVDLVLIDGVLRSAACNPSPAFSENWSVGDTLGLDNDGDNFYDEADPDCVPEPGAGMMGLAALLGIAGLARTPLRSA